MNKPITTDEIDNHIASLTPQRKDEYLKSVLCDIVVNVGIDSIQELEKYIDDADSRDQLIRDEEDGPQE